MKASKGLKKRMALHGDKRMTLKEIAEKTGASYRTVADYAQRAGWTENGKQTLLNEKQVTVILEAMKQAHHNQTKDTLQAALQGIETAQSRAVRIAVLSQQQKEIDRQIQAELEAEIVELKAKIEADKDKVELAERALLSEDVLSLNTAAKTLKLPYGVIKFAEKLRDMGFLMEHPKNIPFQHYINAGYFVVDEVVKEVDGEERVYPTTRVTQKGLMKLSRVFSKRKPLFEM